MSNRNKVEQCSQCGVYARSDNLMRHMERKHQSKKKIQTPSPSIITLPNLEQQSGAVNDIISNYVWKEGNKVEKNHSFHLPRDIRALIVGKSGSGKTTLLMHLLLEPGILDYDTLTVCGNSLHQPEYRVLNSAYSKGLSKEQVSTLFKRQDELKDEYDGSIENFLDEYEGSCKGGINARFLDKVEDVPDPCEHNPTRKNLLILDDVMLGPQNKAEAYYTRGRHNNVDTVYIAQNYFRLPRQTVRENANLFMLFRQDGKNLTHIYQDHCSDDDIPFHTFSKFCTDVWNNTPGKHNFVVIDTTSPPYCGKYRRNLDEYWINKEE